MADPTKIIVSQGDAVAPEQSLSRLPQVHFLTSNVPTPASVYLQQDDQIFVTGRSNFLSAALPVLVRGRFLRTDGTMITIEVDIPIVAGIASVNQFIPLGEGYLLGMTVIPNFSNCPQGSFHVQILIVRNAQSAASQTQCLAAGVCNLQTPVSWPASGIRASFDSQGFMRSITGSTPAAGADINEVVPSFVRWRFVVLEATLTTAVAVANRTVEFVLDDGVNEYCRIPANGVQAASLTVRYTFAPALPDQAAIAGAQIVPTPPALILPAGHRIRTVTANIQAADQWTAPQYLVEEWQSTV